MSRFLRTIADATATITSGQTSTGAIEISGAAFIGLEMPAAFTGTTISFTVSRDGTTFAALYDEFNTLVSMTVAASRNYELPASLTTWGYMKIVSGSSEGADRTLGIALKS
jgi:hypothetical protein